MTAFDDAWKEIDLREPEARAAAKLLSKIGRPWEAYFSDNGFFRVRPKATNRAQSIANFVDAVLKNTATGTIKVKTANKGNNLTLNL